MNKTTLAIAATALLGTSQVAHADYGMAGCGLGSLLITDKSPAVQLFVGTTNGTSNSQTFGITTGTSNCTSDGLVMVDKEQEAFAEVNFDELQYQVAMGQGEHLDAFITLLGCNDGVRSIVAEQAQAAHMTAFPTASTTPQQALYMLKMELSHDRKVRNSCSRI